MTAEGSYQPVPPALIAVSMDEVNQWGCPKCGYRSGSMPVQMGGTGVWRCGECGESCYVLAEGLTEASFGASEDGMGYSIPFRTRGQVQEGSDPPAAAGPKPPTPGRAQLQPHPRRGTPARGRKDIRPDTGGEYFASRGLGRDKVPSCFVCGEILSGEDRKGPYAHNIAAFVQTKEAGERVVAMFGGKGARLDYREREPDHLQVKVGACEAHVSNLERLHQITHAAGRIIREDTLAAARCAEAVS